jgi:hypothetical protein
LVFPSLPFMCFSQFSSIFLRFPLFLTISHHFPWFFPTFFIPLSRDLGGIEPHHYQIA